MNYNPVGIIIMSVFFAMLSTGRYHDGYDRRNFITAL